MLPWLGRLCVRGTGHLSARSGGEACWRIARRPIQTLLLKAMDTLTSRYRLQQSSGSGCNKREPIVMFCGTYARVPWP